MYDKRLARLISYIHHTCEFKQCCHVGSAASQCRLGLFQDCDFAGDLEDSKSTSSGLLCIFGSHTYRGKVKADDDELGHLCLDKFFDCEQSDCNEKSGETQSTLSSSSQGWHNDAFLDVSAGKLVVPGYPDNPENSGDSGTESNDVNWPNNLQRSSQS